MSERKYRRFTAEEKLEILKEAEQPGVTIAKVCRKRRLVASMFYAWRAVAHQAVGSAMKNTDRRGQNKPDAETERLRAELERMRAVVAEITAENLDLKKDMKLDSSKRVRGAVKMEVLELVARTRDRSRWKLDEVLVALGVTRSVYFAWQRRRLAGRLEDMHVKAPCLDVLLPEEVEAIEGFALQHPLVGYRKLSWMMVDAGIAYASESAVYRVLHEAGMLSC